jgi:hypothetical protein
MAAGYPARQLSNPFEGAELRCPLSDNLCGILQSVGDQVSVHPIDLPPLHYGGCTDPGLMIGAALSRCRFD